MNQAFEESDDLINHPMNIKLCSQCDKFITCFIFRDFAKVIIQNQLSEKERYAVDPLHIAQICPQYHAKNGDE